MRKLLFPVLSVLIIITVLNFVHPVYAVHQDILYSKADCGIWSAYPNNNYYATSSVGYAGNNTNYFLPPNGTQILFFKFNMSEALNVELDQGQEIVISSIIFKLYSHYYFGDHFYTFAYSTNQTWTETGITWNDHPSFTEANEDVLVDTDEKYFDWDCIEAQSEIENAIENSQSFTVVITPNGYEGKGSKFRMREYGGMTFDPCLIINYYITGAGAEEWAEEINLDTFPIALGAALHIGTFGGQILASSFVLMMFLLPVSIWSKNNMVALIIGITIMSFLIGIGWLPIWILLALSMLIASMYASKIKEWIGGK